MFSGHPKFSELDSTLSRIRWHQPDGVSENVEDQRACPRLAHSEHRTDRGHSQLSPGGAEEGGGVAPAMASPGIEMHTW
jgi:hypothetical protein